MKAAPPAPYAGDKPRPTKKKSKRRPIRSNVRNTLLVLCILAAVAYSGFLGYYVFQVANVEVQGLISIPAEDVVRSAGIQLGDNLFAVDTLRVKKAIQTNPFLDVLAVRRQWPDTIVIEVRERQMKLALAYGASYVLIDTEGTAIAFAEGLQRTTVVQGVVCDAVVLGNRIVALDDYSIHTLQQITAAFEKTPIAGETISIDLSIPNMVSMKLRCGLTVRLGEVYGADMVQKAAWVTALYPELVADGRIYGTLDLTGDTHASYIPSE